MSRRGPRHETEPLVDVGLACKCLEKHKDILADLGAYKHMCSSSGPNAKALHATRKLWTGLLDLEPSGLIHSHWDRLFCLCWQGTQISTWGNILGWCGPIWRWRRWTASWHTSGNLATAKLTRDQYHELLVGLKKLKMPSKTELALVPVAAAKEELGKAPSAKSKAATSELGRASPQKKAHVLGKAKLGKAKPSKKAGKLGKSWQGGCPWKR